VLQCWLLGVGLYVVSALPSPPDEDPSSLQFTETVDDSLTAGLPWINVVLTCHDVPQMSKDNLTQSFDAFLIQEAVDNVTSSKSRKEKEAHMTHITHLHDIQQQLTRAMALAEGNSSLNMTSNSSAEISRLKKENEELRTLLAKLLNERQEQETAVTGAVLKVRPGKPTFSYVTHHSIRVVWSLPPLKGNQYLTGYKLFKTVGKNTQSIYLPPTALSYLVTELDPGTVYDFTVQAFTQDTSTLKSESSRRATMGLPTRRLDTVLTTAAAPHDKAVKIFYDTYRTDFELRVGHAFTVGPANTSEVLYMSGFVPQADETSEAIINLKFPVRRAHPPAAKVVQYAFDSYDQCVTITWDLPNRKLYATELWVAVGEGNPYELVYRGPSRHFPLILLWREVYRFKIRHISPTRIGTFGPEARYIFTGFGRE